MNGSDNGLIWEAPPPSGAYQMAGYWDNILSQLVARPHEWAVVYTQLDGQSEEAARNRRVMMRGAALRNGVSVQIMSRKIDGRIKVYARTVTP